MSTSIDTSSWSAQEFMAFVMLYACEANGHNSKDDCVWISGRVGDQPFQSAYDAFTTHSDIEMIEVIADMRKRFYPGDAGKQLIHQNLVDLFQADGKFTAMEHHVLHEIERMFE